MPEPVIEGFFPASGEVGAQVTLQGGPFAPNAQVFLGNIPCAIQSRSPNQFVVSVPPGMIGRAPFVITDPSGARAVSPDVFVVTLPGR